MCMENRRRIKRRPNGQMATIGFHRRLLPLVLYHRAEHCRLLPSSTCPPRNFRNATFATQEPEDQSHILLLYHICTWGHQFHSAHFHSAYFHSVHFHSAYFHSAYFHSAHFHSAHFHSVQFHPVYFHSAHYHWAHFHSAISLRAIFIRSIWIFYQRSFSIYI